MIYISGQQQWFSYRGLAHHQFMPMLGVHKAIKFALCCRPDARNLAPLMAALRPLLAVMESFP